MVKKLRDYQIYIAPYITGYYIEPGVPYVNDEITDENLDPNNLDDKIKIYERQVKYWFLDRANNFLRGNNNGFVILMICISYIEGIEQYRVGQSSNGRSREFFRNSLRRILKVNTSNQVLNDFYSQVRCGLFHNGMTENKVIIRNEYPDVIDFNEPDTIKINPKLLLQAIRRDFKKYIFDLQNDVNEDLRNNFDNMFSVV